MSQEIIDRLNELLECERAGVEAAMGLATSGAPGFSHGELQKFAEDEGWACGNLRKAILRCGGRPSERTGAFAGKVLAVEAEGERVSLLARGQAWVVMRIEAPLAKDPDPETRAFLTEMREQHLENIEACHRRAEELQAPPAPPTAGWPSPTSARPMTASTTGAGAGPRPPRWTSGGPTARSDAIWML